MRAFASLRHLANMPNTNDRISKIEHELEMIHKEMNDVIHDQNEINEDTRAQLDAISTALAELQAKEPTKKERKPIGFIQSKND